MFSVFCVGCDAEVLLSPRRILRLHNTAHGVVVRFRCWAGHVGSWAAAGEGGTPLPRQLAEV